MNVLIFHCSCLEGNYTLKADWTAEGLTWTVETDIEALQSGTGELSSVKEFSDLLNKADIPHWERRYEADGSAIEDAVRWDLKLDTDGNTYLSEGEETFFPYGYETLIDALALIDPQVRYFSYR